MSKPAATLAPITARPFCAHHPEGVSCQYCQPRAVEPRCSGRDGKARAQRLLKEAKAAQAAYWDAIAKLESGLGLEMEWESLDLTDYTLAQLRDEFPKKG